MRKLFLIQAAVPGAASLFRGSRTVEKHDSSIRRHITSRSDEEIRCISHRKGQFLKIRYKWKK
ncbi:MAG: hypothetical protein JXR86_04250 [Spirochaetales bacterium]|nr:hypothetical protein [Spirochaetales bacterium]